MIDKNSADEINKPLADVRKGLEREGELIMF